MVRSHAGVLFIYFLFFLVMFGLRVHLGVALCLPLYCGFGLAFCFSPNTFPLRTCLDCTAPVNRGRERVCVCREFAVLL